MPTSVIKFQVRASFPGDIYGNDVAKIQGNQHLFCIDYYSCCIFERKLTNLQTSSIIEALKSIFVDVRVPDKIISDNVKYFVLDYQN